MKTLFSFLASFLILLSVGTAQSSTNPPPKHRVKQQARFSTAKVKLNPNTSGPRTVVRMQREGRKIANTYSPHHQKRVQEASKRRSASFPGKPSHGAKVKVQYSAKQEQKIRRSTILLPSQLFPLPNQNKERKARKEKD